MRLTRDPFPLFPGEILKEDVKALTIVMANSALRLRAVLDIEDKEQKRVAGDEWLFEGPGKDHGCYMLFPLHTFLTIILLKLYIYISDITLAWHLAATNSLQF